LEIQFQVLEIPPNILTLRCTFVDLGRLSDKIAGFEKGASCELNRVF
jgi:hypothetical protein